MIEIEFNERDGETTVVFTHRDLWDEEAWPTTRTAGAVLREPQAGLES